MYCGNCGNEFQPNDKFCGTCGSPNPKYVNKVEKSTTVVTSSANSETTEKVFYGIIGFCAPLIGLILSIVTRKDKPEAAKVGIIVSSIFLFIRVIYFVVVTLVSILEYI